MCWDGHSSAGSQVLQVNKHWFSVEQGGFEMFVVALGVSLAVAVNSKDDI